jgi:type IV fimbrial biogenesis protein FimT
VALGTDTSSDRYPEIVSNVDNDFGGQPAPPFVNHYYRSSVMRQKYIRGFTIPEVIITLGVAAIILSTAVPGVSNTIKDNRLATRVNNIITDIHFARSEAAKRDVRVILCRSKYPDASAPSCSTDSGTEYTWTWGYLIFADNTANSIYNAGSDILLRRGQPAPSGVRMRTSSAWNKNLEINPNGSTNEGGATAMMSICDDRGKEHGKQIAVAPSGIPKMYSGNISTCTP